MIPNIFVLSATVLARYSIKFHQKVTRKNRDLLALHGHTLTEYSIMINNDNILGCTVSKSLAIIGKEQRDSLAIEFCEQKHTAGVCD